jgi:hypothetical protein
MHRNRLVAPFLIKRSLSPSPLGAPSSDTSSPHLRFLVTPAHLEALFCCRFFAAKMRGRTSTIPAHFLKALNIFAQAKWPKIHDQETGMEFYPEPAKSAKTALQMP